MKAITLNLLAWEIEKLDELVKKGLYPNRAEAIRLAIKDLIDADVVRELRLQRVDVDVKESAVEIREAGQVWTVEIQRDPDGKIWGVYPGKPVNDDMIFTDGLRNLLILFQKGVLRFEDLKRRPAKEVEAK